jgi:hypothetical protein
MSAHAGLDTPKQGSHWNGCWKEHQVCAWAEIDRLRSDLAAARALLREVNVRAQGTIAEYEEYLGRIDAALAGKDAP